MSRRVTFSCSVPTIAGKKKKLKVDENGYYECALGAFNIYNSEGKYYPLLESVSDMFKPGGAFRRRLDTGQCRGEVDHPELKPGWSLMTWIKRLLKIDPARVSHHISTVALEERKDENGNNIVLVTGLVKPSGPYADALKSSLENTEENAAFSIRSLAEDVPKQGRIEKHISDIITYDWVNEPGIAVATKYNTPTLEELTEEITISEAQLRAIASGNLPGVGAESASEATRILTNLGWEKVELFKPTEVIKPKYLEW